MPYAYQGGDNCYGRGDYYRGDYYRGDPGILGGLAKLVGKGIGIAARIGVAIARRSPVGTAVTLGAAGIGLAARALQRGGTPGSTAQLPAGSYQLPLVGSPIPGGGSITAFGGYQPPGMGVCTIKGMRLNKSTYVTRGGATSRWPMELIVHPKGTECVKTRRMNVCNPRALRRGIRRAQGFAKLARRVLSFVSAKAPKGRARFKKK